LPCLGPGAAWLLVADEVDGGLAQDLSGSRVDGLDVEVVDQEQDVGSCVGSPDVDVTQLPSGPRPIALRRAVTMKSGRVIVRRKVSDFGLGCCASQPLTTSAGVNGSVLTIAM
jgi:hypothetical protein